MYVLSPTSVAVFTPALDSGMSPIKVHESVAGSYVSIVEDFTNSIVPLLSRLV